SCNVTAMAAATRRPGQVLGLHFFNPVPLMKLVEVVRTILSDETAVRTATEWVRAVGKTPVQAKDATAFIANRLRCRISSTPSACTRAAWQRSRISTKR